MYIGKRHRHRRNSGRIQSVFTPPNCYRTDRLLHDIPANTYTYRHEADFLMTFELVALSADSIIVQFRVGGTPENPDANNQMMVVPFSDGSVLLGENLAGSLTFPASAAAGSVQAGDIIGVEAIAANIRVLRKRAGVWTELIDFPNATNLVNNTVGYVGYIGANGAVANLWAYPDSADCQTYLGFPA